MLRAQLRSKPVGPAMAYRSFCSIVSRSEYGGSFSWHMQVALEGSLGRARRGIWVGGWGHGAWGRSKVRLGLGFGLVLGLGLELGLGLA